MDVTFPIPSSGLGRLTGRFHLDESNPLIAMNCYFDGSVGGTSDEWLGLGGLIATDEAFAEFEKNWRAMLKDRYPIALYHHMTDLVTGNGDFRRADGWDIEKRDSLISNAIKVILSMDQSKVCGFACAIDVRAHKRLKAEGYALPKPAVICAELGLAQLLAWFYADHPFQLAYAFYDQNEPFIKSIRSRWLVEENNKRKIKTPFLGMIANIVPANMKETPGIQAADILAWAFIRKLRGAPGDKWAGLADNLLGNRERRGLLTACQIDPITEDVMRVKYPKGEEY